MRKTLLNTMGLLLALFGATNASAQSTVELLTLSPSILPTMFGPCLMPVRHLVPHGYSITIGATTVSASATRGQLHRATALEPIRVNLTTTTFLRHSV